MYYFSKTSTPNSTGNSIANSLCYCLLSRPNFEHCTDAFTCPVTESRTLTKYLCTWNRRRVKLQLHQCPTYINGHSILGIVQFAHIRSIVSAGESLNLMSFDVLRVLDLRSVLCPKSGNV